MKDRTWLFFVGHSVSIPHIEDMPFCLSAHYCSVLLFLVIVSDPLFCSVLFCCLRFLYLILFSSSFPFCVCLRSFASGWFFVLCVRECIPFLFISLSIWLSVSLPVRHLKCFSPHKDELLCYVFLHGCLPSTEDFFLLPSSPDSFWHERHQLFDRTNQLCLSFKCSSFTQFHNILPCLCPLSWDVLIEHRNSYILLPPYFFALSFLLSLFLSFPFDEQEMGWNLRERRDNRKKNSVRGENESLLLGQMPVSLKSQVRSEKWEMVATSHFCLEEGNSQWQVHTWREIGRNNADKGMKKMQEKRGKHLLTRGSHLILLLVHKQQRNPSLMTFY